MCGVYGRGFLRIAVVSTYRENNDLKVVFRRLRYLEESPVVRLHMVLAELHCLECIFIRATHKERQSRARSGNTLQLFGA